MLEDAGVKLATVATDVIGVSRRAMMRALIEGQADPDALAELAKGKLRLKLPALRKALQGRFEDHHAFLLQRMLAHIEELEADLQAVSERIEAEIRPFERALELLDTIPGVDRRAAEVIVAETGADMSRFPTAPHVASWAGLDPDQNESAGKRNSGKTRKGSKWLRMTLIESAPAASRSNGTHLQQRYQQLVRRCGDKKAIAHEILSTSWQLLSTDQPYHDPGPARLQQQEIERVRRRAIRQLEALGHKVILETLPDAA